MQSAERKSLLTQIAAMQSPFHFRDRVRRRMPPAHRKEAKRFAKFMIIGMIGFIIDTSTLSFLVFGAHLNEDGERLLAKAIAFSLAVSSNFIWNRYWTYPESRSKSLKKQVTQFFTMNIVGLGINLMVFGAADSLLIPLVGSTLALYGAQLAAVSIAMFWNFLSNRLVTFNDVKFGSP